MSLYICVIGFNGMSDWWSTLDSEQSQSELIQMDASRSICRGPEFVPSSSLYEHDGLYVSLRKGQLQYSTSKPAKVT